MRKRLAGLILGAAALVATSARAQVNYNYTGPLAYPIQFNVSGYSGPITNLRVTLKGLNTANLRNVAVMLQGPNGKLVIMANASNVAYNGDLTLSDGSPALPSTGAVPVGTYAPRAYGSVLGTLIFPPIFPEEPNRVFDPSEAVTPAGTGSLSGLNGTDANGTWYLRIIGSPTITGATLTITTNLDIEMTKTHSGNFTQGQNARTYTLGVRNASASALTSQLVTVTDAIPPGLTATVAGTGGTGWACSVLPPAPPDIQVQRVVCTRTEALPALSAFPNITVTVNVASDAPGLVTNVAFVTFGGAGDGNADNNFANDPTTVLQIADLSITNTDGVTTVVPGLPITYTIVVSNAGPSRIVNASVSAFFSFLNNVSFTATATGGATDFDTSGSFGINDQVTMPAGSTITYLLSATVNPSAPAGPFANTATVTMPFPEGFDTNLGNNSATDTDTSTPQANLSIVKTASANTATDVDLTWTVTLTNAGPSDAHNVSITDTLPIPFVSQTQTSNQFLYFFSLGQTGNSITDTIATFPAGATVTFEFVGHVPPATGPDVPITNTVTVTSADDPVTSNNTSSVTTRTNAPDVVVTKTHVGSFRQGDAARSYTITVTNNGLATTTGTVLVMDALPPSLTATAMSGTGWNCTLGAVSSCTRSDPLAPAASYPPITLVVMVAVNAPPSVDNTVTVFGGGEVNTANGTATDTTIIIQAPDLTVAQSQPGGVVFGQTGVALSIVVSNNGGGVTSETASLAVALTGGVGLTPTSITGAGWTCALNTLTCTRANALDPGAAYPAITLLLNVESNADCCFTSTATVSGGGEVNSSNNSAVSTVDVFAPFGPPFPFAATTTGAGQVSISWGRVFGAVSYALFRATSISGPWTPVGQPATSPAMDSGLAANTTYLYRIQAVGAGAVTSGFSVIDAATTVVFTDDPLAAGSAIKAEHVLQLRIAVNAMRAAAGLGAYPFADSGLTSGFPIRAIHVEQLRAGMGEARAIIGQPALFAPGTSIVPGAVIRKADIDLIRAGAK